MHAHVRDHAGTTEDHAADPAPPAWRLAGEDEEDADPHICRGVD